MSFRLETLVCLKPSMWIMKRWDFGALEEVNEV